MGAVITFSAVVILGIIFRRAIRHIFWWIVIIAIIAGIIWAAIHFGFVKCFWAFVILIAVGLFGRHCCGWE